MCPSVLAKPLFHVCVPLPKGRVSASNERRQAFRFSQDGHTRTSQVLVELLLESISFRERRNTGIDDPTAASLDIPQYSGV